MKLQFEANQEYQIQAVQSIVDLFDGQPVQKSAFEFAFTTDLINESGVGNNLVLSDDHFLDNLRKVQIKNGIPAAEQLAGLNFSVEMETELRKLAIANLNPLCTLRYSATHTNLYNLVYKLDPVQAYDLGLVKQIEVDSVFAENEYNQAYIKLESVKSAKTKTTAKLLIDVNSDKGVVRKTVTGKVGDDLFGLSGRREMYREGFIINAINIEDQCIELSNGKVLSVGETQGGLTDEIMKVQIRKAVEEHFHKELNLKSKGIKVLTLFFIDRVANYRKYDETGNSVKSKFAVWFEQIFIELTNKPQFKGIIPFKVAEVHNGYFAQDKNHQFKDSSESRETQADDDTYQLIMQDKERLLDITNPLRFIFSHSALREGWDNPNVFQICTLNETKSELKKRQEIGRGLRLSVDNTGLRIRDKNINKLTVIANESYDEFARKLQQEIETDCGVQFTGRIKDKSKRVKVQLKKGYELDPKFIELWNKIKYKTTYRVKYDTDDLIRNAGKSIQQMPEVKPPIIKFIKTGLTMLREEISGYQLQTTQYQADNFVLEIPDIIGYIQSKTELTRGTILRILKESGRLKDVLKNPQLFLDLAVAEIKNVLYNLMIAGIKYEKIGAQEYAMMLFENNEIETYLENLYPVKNQNKTITNYIVIDSLSETEKQFAQDCETTENIEFYIKLPEWFKINTPIGTYNPDWALIFKNDKKIYFVAETKSTLNLWQLRDTERMKIQCGKAHFTELKNVEFKQVTRISDLL